MITQFQLEKLKCAFSCSVIVRALIAVSILLFFCLSVILALQLLTVDAYQHPFYQLIIHSVRKIFDITVKGSICFKYHLSQGLLNFFLILGPFLVENKEIEIVIMIK